MIQWILKVEPIKMLADSRIESCLKVEEKQGVARIRENQGVELVEVAFGLRHEGRPRPVLSNDMQSVDALGGRTSATRDTRLMCVIEEPVIPDTKASLSVLYPCVIFTTEPVTHGHVTK